MADKGKILYDELVQDALVGVVRKVLLDTAKFGLQGAHHFYIAFRTDHPGVVMPAYLRERYKDEMTIVLQNQFWDLQVADDHFSVGLSFNQKPAKLSIPFDAMTGFLDPSVEFGLQFQRARPEAKKKPAAGEPAVTQPGEQALSAAPEIKAPEIKAVGKPKPDRPKPDRPKPDKAEAPNTDGKGPDGPDDPDGAAKVVALDAFRKKN